MTYEIRPNCYEGMNPTSWQVFETEAHGPGSVVAVCLREGNARRIRDLLNDCTITTANQLATLHGNFARLMADRDATYERWNAALDRLETMRRLIGEVRTERDTADGRLISMQKELAEIRTERDTLAAKLLTEQTEGGKLSEERDRLRILLIAARSQVNDLSSRLQNGSEPATITGLTEALTTASRCMLLHPSTRRAFELLAKVYEGGGK